MQAVVSVLPAEQDVSGIVRDLEQAGVPHERIAVYADEQDARRLLGCEPVCMVRRYALTGMAIGIGVYLVYAVIAGWGEMLVLGFTATVSLAAFLGGLLAGAFVGGLLGLAYGFGVYEETDYQWVEKVRQGGHLLVVSASPQEALDVQQLLAGRQVRIVRSTA